MTLDGTLELSLINGFSPMPGDTFEIITAGSVVDTFATVTGTDLLDGMFFEVLYFPDSVVLSVVPEPNSLLLCLAGLLSLGRFRRARLL